MPFFSPGLPTTSLQLSGSITDETGTGALVFATSPALITPALGVATAGKLTITPVTEVTPLTLTGGSITGTTSTPLISATQTWNNAGLTATAFGVSITDTSSNASSLLVDLKVNGTSQFSVSKTGVLTLDSPAAGAAVISSVRAVRVNPSSGWNFLVSSNTASLQFESTATVFQIGTDSFFGRNAAAAFRFGATDAAAPVAQTLGVQSVIGGTSNKAGVDWTFKASVGTGTGAGGSFIWQVAPAGGSGTAQNALGTALSIDGAANVVCGNAALATTATNGFLYIPTCAGTPTGVPTTKTGRVAMIFDDTNNKFYIYNSGWKGGTVPGVFI